MLAKLGSQTNSNGDGLRYASSLHNRERLAESGIGNRAGYPSVNQPLESASTTAVIQGDFLMRDFKEQQTINSSSLGNHVISYDSFRNGSAGLEQHS